MAYCSSSSPFNGRMEHKYRTGASINTLRPISIKQQKNFLNGSNHKDHFNICQIKVWWCFAWVSSFAISVDVCLCYPQTRLLSSPVYPVNSPYAINLQFVVNDVPFLISHSSCVRSHVMSKCSLRRNVWLPTCMDFLYFMPLEWRKELVSIRVHIDTPNCFLLL